MSHEPNERLRCGLATEEGFTLVELLVAIAIFIVITSATLAVLDVAARSQSRDQAYAQEITGTQTALARAVHDLRQATAFQQVSANVVQFQVVANGSTYNVKYDCTAPDSLGSSYTRCARTQAVAPASPPAAGSAAGGLDIQHITNGGINTFCKADGSGPSGAVFFVSNPSINNTDGSTLACDEAYENEIGPQLKLPTFVQVLVKVPASGDLAHGGMTHLTVLKSGAFLPNSDSGA
jgi:prepilin-type N-terminal cleavage/methylation domain-containing protein